MFVKCRSLTVTVNELVNVVRSDRVSGMTTYLPGGNDTWNEPSEAVVKCPTGWRERDGYTVYTVNEVCVGTVLKSKSAIKIPGATSKVGSPNCWMNAWPRIPVDGGAANNE